jgi:chromate transporter
VAIRRLSLRRGWLTEQEFLDTIVLSRLTPGITILAQVLLIGRKVAGVRGMLAAAGGLMLPAVTITLLLARGYEAIASSARAVTPLRCVSGVAAGFAVALALQLLRDTLVRSTRLLGPVLFLVYVGLTVLVHDPLIVIGVALAAGLAVPQLFPTRDVDPGPAPEAEPDAVPAFDPVPTFDPVPNDVPVDSEDPSRDEP